VLDALEAAEDLSGRGIEAEVVDPRTLNPLDQNTILESVKKTGRLIVVHQACMTGGFGAEIVSRVVEAGIPFRVKRVAGEDTPVPYSKPLEERILPSSGKIVEAALALMD
jgi:pyruvate dehydrogenase E1 component beta subunit